jgi:hypothetical protein
MNGMAQTAEMRSSLHPGSSTGQLPNHKHEAAGFVLSLRKLTNTWLSLLCLAAFSFGSIACARSIA